MEVHDHDPRTPAERRGPQADVPARRWIAAGWILAAVFLFALLVQACPAHAQTGGTWTYGGFVDAGYLFAPSDPSDDAFRSRGTAWHVNDLVVNMAGVYTKKLTTPASPWGGEVTVHTGKDDELFGFSATAPNIAGADWLRHLGPTNVSYVAPNGLAIQGGIFSSLIGYDSLYARDNFNYTRPWGADFTPYLMLGLNAAYPINDKVTATGFLVNGYWHLADANAVPSFGGQLAAAITPRLTLKQTVMAGPHQPDTAAGYWRVLADSIVEHKTARFVIAFNGHFATEQVAPGAAIGVPGTRAWWTAAQLPMQWHAGGPWRIALRPEIARDSTGRWTLAEQTVRGFTGTVEYRTAVKWSAASVKFEYRVDHSTGTQGGFFTAREDELAPTQHLWMVAAVFRFDRTQ
jgi:Putative beta-barrel porin-2, OmpL-like. bbp2